MPLHRSASLSAVLLAAAPLLAQGSPIAIPYIAPLTAGSPAHTIQINLSVGSGPTSAYVIDTGSVGLVMPVAELPGAPTGPITTITYTSSGLVFHGVWTSQTVTFPDALVETRPTPAHATVPVFAVSSVYCIPGAPNSHCNKLLSHPPHPHVLGIGFGRPEIYATSDHNPLLHLRAMESGLLDRSYLLSTASITLGLGSSALSSDFVLLHLTPAVAASDWQTPAGTFALGSAPPASSGSILIDTGILDTLFAASGHPTSGTVPPGTVVQLSLLAGKLTHRYALGDGAPATPTSAHWIAPLHGTFVNTGVTLLNRFDVFFDANDGAFALRPHP